VSARLQIQAKTKPKSTPSLVPMRSGCLRRRAANQVDPATVPPIVHDVLRSPGQPLDTVVQAPVGTIQLTGEGDPAHLGQHTAWAVYGGIGK
jgi:hypothetical protein